MSQLSIKQWDLLTRIVASAFFVSAAITAFIGYLNFSPLTVVEANSSDITSARSRYPALAGSRIDSCSLCHTSAIPSLNPYGTAYKAAGRSPAALAAIEDQDSDGDGFSNLAEISALFFPGNANDRPAVATPTSPPPTPLPPTPTQPAPTAVPPTATQPAPTNVPPTETQPAPTDLPPTAEPPTPTQEIQPTQTAVLDPTTTLEPTLEPSPTLQPSPTATLQCKNEDDKEKKDKKDKDKKEKDKKDKDKKSDKGNDGKKNNPCKPDDDHDEKDDEKDHSRLISPEVPASNDAGARRLRLNG